MYFVNRRILFCNLSQKGLIVPTRLEHEAVPCAVSPMKVTLQFYLCLSASQEVTRQFSMPSSYNSIPVLCTYDQLYKYTNTSTYFLIMYGHCSGITCFYTVKHCKELHPKSILLSNCSFPNTIHIAKQSCDECYYGNHTEPSDMVI